MELSPTQTKISTFNMIEKYSCVNKTIQTNKTIKKEKNLKSNTLKPIDLFEINASLHQKTEAELLLFEESTIKSVLDDEPEELEDNYQENIYYNIDGNHLATTDEDNIY